MMLIYLPIAEITINLLWLLGIGASVGFLSGMFGVGGGFLMTPLLMFTGVPASVAVASGAAQIVASSLSGAIAQWRRKAVDFRMGFVLLMGGILGSSIGIVIFRALKAVGQIDLIISMLYVVLLGVVGTLTLYESFQVIRRSRAGTGARKPQAHHNWFHGLPLKMRFQRSRLYVSAIPPASLGFLAGMLGSIMGVGGGFFLVPAMIYLLRMPTNVVIGTSLFPIIFTMAFTSILHAATNKTVDIVLAIFLIIGGVVGVQLGTIVGERLKGEQLRALLGLIILAVAIRLSIDLVVAPADLFSIELLK